MGPSGQLSADQLTKLAVMVAPVMPKHPSFWNVRKTQKLIADRAFAAGWADEDILMG